ncbi:MULTISPECIES: hypothetical protein [Pseudanabaena]|uniref:Uncharacterized protein n=2 Tax=Pseudanabaena TaxID=1152 RepID=L8MZA1_9CYAN|nr:MULTISPECIES: hypothetical protein [Pseudanabaena]ELS32134.1 hypothetical protein Pse7429DRAFT_2664 [Pseudanabaena biceps PCC 7429]MDG3495616.1 hypothetical protein [Pseudanabaena catenata USMAC16]
MTPYQIGYLVGTLVTPLILMLVIGTIYYWIKGGRIPYRQAILSRWVIVASLILFLLGLFGRASSYLQQESSHVYPERDIKAFTEGCVGSAKKKLDIKAAESFCTCSITEIQKAYTYGEFRKFDAEMNQQKSMPSGIKNIVTSCAQKP